jgi:hypothetical protein
MKKNLSLTLLSVFCTTIGLSQTDISWNSVKKSESIEVSKMVQRESFPKDFLLYELNIENLKHDLSYAKDRFASKKGILITLPNTKGKLEEFEVFEASNFEPDLQAKFPDIRSYVGKSKIDPNAQLRLAVSPSGIQTAIFRVGIPSEFMEPYSKDHKIYAVYKSSRNKSQNGFNCSTVDEMAITDKFINTNLSSKSNNKAWKTFRLVISCTGEYGALFGGVPQALAQMNATMTRVNGVLEKDLALHLNLIANNTDVIYVDPATDPYSIPSIGNGNNPTWNLELQTTLTNVIGNANYDIGHLFGDSGGGGNAGCIGCICVDPTPSVPRGKGSGYTSPADGSPSGDTFDIDFVAHEIGHQIGANHTFAFGNFSGTENTQVNVEPGSGTTIMAYAGITGATDVQKNSDDYFTYRSILQIQSNLESKTCGTGLSLSNNPPVISAGVNLILPKGTPFILTGTGSDSDGDAITYCWEQNDDATTVGSAPSFPSGTKTDGPNFRSYKPVSTPVRYFPSIQSILNGSIWEVVPTIERTLNFTLTGRDNAVGAYQTNTSAISVTFSGTVGPLEITSQNTDGISWKQGDAQNITWSVNNTTTLSGSDNVDILLSTDGGLTYPTTLISNTPNDGAQMITVPNVAAPFCRIMIKPTGNVYFNINTKPFAIGYTVTSTIVCTPYTRTFSPPRAMTTTWAGYGIPAPGAIIPDIFTVTDANVTVDCIATSTSEVSFGIVKPGGNTVSPVLFDGPTSNCDVSIANLKATFDDEAVAFDCNATASGLSYIPLEALSGLDGTNSNGNWGIAAKSTNTANTIKSLTLTLCRTDIKVIENPLSTQIFEFQDLSVSPIPNKGNFNIKLSSLSNENIKVNVFDMRGREIYEKSFSNTGAFNQDITLNKVQSGIYLVSITDGVKKTVKRIVVE